jgi:ketosteroid isomerase-like protein
MTQDMRRIIERIDREVWQEQRLETVDELYADDFVLHTPFPGYGSDRESFKRWVRDATAALKIIDYRADEPIIEGDRLAYKWIVKVRHVGEMFGFEPTGYEAEYGAATINRFRDGKVVEEWNYIDTFSLMVQLRMIKVPELAGSRR